MTGRLFLLILSILFLSHSSCENEIIEFSPTPSTSKNKILPLGASRVEGARPDFESYRYELWKLLEEGGWEFDFIGTERDEASYPNESFDADHQGNGGFTSGQILGEIEEWLSYTGAPDIVLFSSPGGNDGLNGAPVEDAIANVNAIIDILQSSNPNVTIIIEQLAPAISAEMTPQLSDFFQKMNQAVLSIATEQSTNTSNVIAVDMFTGFTDDYLADDVHYNETGAVFIANRYYPILETILKP